MYTSYTWQKIREKHIKSPGRNSDAPRAVHDAVQAMCDGEDSAVWKLFADGILNEVVRLQVNSCCSLIQD